MKHILISLFFLLFSAISVAQEITCLDKLLPYNRHSGLHQVFFDEWTDGKEILDAQAAETALKFLVNSKLLCKTDEVIIKVAPVCSHIIGDLDQSTTCFAFTNVGFFVFSKDNVKNINIIFSKDKRFSGNNL